MNGLAHGKTTFSWRLGIGFFRSFGNGEMLDAEVLVRAEARKNGDCTDVDLRMDGFLTVACDRCLGELRVPVSSSVALSIAGEDGGRVADDGREVVEVSDGAGEFDLGQTIYDYVCLSLPLRCVHEEGDCDADVVGRIGEAGDGGVGGSPFAALKDLLES